MSTLDYSAVVQRLHQAREARVPATLSTILADDAARGFPFGSHIPFGLSSDDRIVIVVSDLAVHTTNLRRDSRASITIAEPGADPQRGWRLTIVGRFAEDDSHKGAYAKTWPVPALADFHAFVLEPQVARLIVGFGTRGWVQPSH
jgi:putative heme iron utilization protein